MYDSWEQMFAILVDAPASLAASSKVEDLLC